MHSAYSDDELEREFADCALPPEVLTHEGHLRLAWIHIHKYGVKQAVGNLCRQIRHYDNEVGQGTKYHETVTVAAVYTVWHFMQKTQAGTFEKLLGLCPRLKPHFIELLAQHYSFDVFKHEQAASTFVPPDLEPFT